MKTEKKTEKKKGSDKKESKKKAASFVVVPNEYNGKAMFTIAREEDVEDDKFTGRFPAFTCGLSKAKLILDHIDELAEYVAKQDKKK